VIYVDVNAIYYFLTAHPQYGPRVKRLFQQYIGELATSALTPWLVFVLTKNPKAAEAVLQLVDILPLTADIYLLALQLEKPRDFEDRLHYATMKKHGIKRIISNDRDFDGLDVERIF